MRMSPLPREPLKGKEDSSKLVLVWLANAKVDQSTSNSGRGRLLSFVKRMNNVAKRLLVEAMKAGLS